MNRGFIIGIIGGMGSYATVDFFRRLVEAFPAEKEWERPRIIVDNFCTMPSRVRAILYNERREELLQCLCNSAINLYRWGAAKIILACNTSHAFLEEVEKRVPECKGKFLHIIDTLGSDMQKHGVKSAYLLASEGTIDCGIYTEHFVPFGIKLTNPSSEQYALLREWIEAVKQNKISDSVLQTFMEFVDASSESDLILGCTELPILYAKAKNTDWIPKVRIFDPLESAIEVLKKEYYSIKISN